MGKADAIIISLRDSWKQLLDRRQELKELYDNSKPSDEDNEDIREDYEGARRIYDAHLQNIATNVKNQFYTLDEVRNIDSALADEIEDLVEGD